MLVEPDAPLDSTFAVECHVTWQRELQADAPFVITSEVLAYDSKRIHQFMRMYHDEAGYLAATAEWMNLHVNLETRRVAPWPEAVDVVAHERSAWNGSRARPHRGFCARPAGRFDAGRGRPADARQAARLRDRRLAAAGRAAERRVTA